MANRTTGRTVDTMDIVDILTRAQGGAGLRNIGNRVGLDENQTRLALEQLAPVIAAGLRRNAQEPQGLTDLIGALQRGDHGRYMDDAAALDRAQEDGNGILGHIFGSKDVSRDIASHAAGQTGIGSAILKQLLPIIASMVMGSMSNRTREPGLQDILGDVLGGGSGGSGRSRGGQSGRGGGGLLESILGGILGGASNSRRGGSNSRETTSSQTQFDDIFGEILGGGSSRGGSARDRDDTPTRRRSSNNSAAEDLLESVLRRTRR